jgi:phosphoserine/homoserine phosphotransferase
MAVAGNANGSETPGLPSRPAVDMQRSLRGGRCTSLLGAGAMQVVCLDLEGVLVPEIWIEFSQRTGIAEFARTTRDEPDYDKLMRQRLALLARHGLKLADIQRVIEGMGALPGAREFLDELRSRFQVFILSDTFYEFADPLMRQLARPTLLCHRLVVDAQGFVRGYRLRQVDQKRMAVNALKGLNYQVIAAGDSFNDIGMLEAAHAGFFIHAPQPIVATYPQFPAMHNYAELAAAIEQAGARLQAAA